MIYKPLLYPKFTQVDEKLYRGSAPYNPLRLYRMKKNGINQVIDLRNSARIASHIEKFFCKLFGLKYVHHRYPHRLDYVPEHSFFSRLNEIILKNNGATYLHCQHGKRRTSICVAVYEKEHTNKSKSEILKELVELGFNEIFKPKNTKKRIKYRKIYNDFLQKYYGIWQ